MSELRALVERMRGEAKNWDCVGHDGVSVAARLRSYAGELAAVLARMEGMVLVPRHTDNLQLLEAVAGRGLCYGTKPIPELVTAAKAKWTVIVQMAEIAAAEEEGE